MPSNDVHIYIDDDTGYKYIFDGTNLVRLPDDSGSGGTDSDNNQNQEINDENNDSLDSNSNDDDNNDEEDSSDKKAKKPQIGDKADLSDEDEEREKQASQEREEDNEPEETAEERQKRLDRIKRYLSDDTLGDQVSYESEKKVTAEKQRKKAAAKKDLEKNLKGAERNAHVVSLLGKDLKQFLGKLVGKQERTASWRKYNANYANVGLIRPGYRNEPVGKIPLIQVYVDQSGSWGENDIKLANDILKSIKEFEDKNLIKVQVYYFADHIHDNPDDARAEGGTRAGTELIQQLNEQKPENVIVLTDSDFDGQGGVNGSYTAPGGVWMVFRDKRSQSLMQALKGRLQTKYYDIDRVR